MTKVAIRSITIHLPRPERWETDFVEDYLEEWTYKVLEASDRISPQIDLEITTLRLTLPNIPLSAINDVASLSRKIEENVLISLGGLPPALDKVEDFIFSSIKEGFYMHITIGEPSWNILRRVARLFNRLSEEEPDMATRFGINLSGEELLTPFYPLSWSPGEKIPLITSCLTYPSALLEAYRASGFEGLKSEVKKWAKEASSVGKSFANEIKGSFKGVDLSVAPWMEDSSLGLVEVIAGVRLPEPGIAYGISLVNKALREVSNSIKSVGFNSVQLPLGEDLKLKLRASEGELRARDLARLCGACLAGLDMVVVPFDDVKVAGLLFDIAAYVRSDKVLGARIITLSGIEEGDKVFTKRFGEIPVIAI